MPGCSCILHFKRTKLGHKTKILEVPLASRVLPPLLHCLSISPVLLDQTSHTHHLRMCNIRAAREDYKIKERLKKLKVELKKINKLTKKISNLRLQKTIRHNYSFLPVEECNIDEGKNLGN